MAPRSRAAPASQSLLLSLALSLGVLHGCTPAASDGGDPPPATVDLSCKPCVADAECPGGRCETIDGQTACLMSCTGGGCAVGYACEPGPAGSRCLPDSRSCACTAAAAGQTRGCQVTNAAGTCAGTERCDPATGWESCSAATPAAETCNGADDDCDGQVDDGLATPLCPNQLGVCSGSRQTCDGAGPQPCTAASYGPHFEADETSCDGLDNDCDGLVDEPFLVAGEYGTPEHCGACGRSCVGTIAHGTASCDAVSSPPRCVAETCDPGYAWAETSCLPVTMGLCDACVAPENCALPTAQCAALDDGSFCLNPCRDGADCPSGFTCRDPGTGSLVCTPDTNACGCDGSNTSLQRSCAVDSPLGYACIGLQQCSVSGWSSCDLPTESCNGFDDDCDGSVDEGFVDGSGRYSSDQDCGHCGVDCTLVSFPGGAGSCNPLPDVPVCSVTCTPSCFDLNADPADGCECCDPTPDDLPDPSGIDANCDGIDGNAALAIFVASSGSDANPGTRLAPKRTLGAAIAAAAAAGKRDVYVAGGYYAETVTLAAGVGVYGGYSTDFRSRDPATFQAVLAAGADVPGRPGVVNAVGIDSGAPGTTVLDGFTVIGPTRPAPSQSSYALYVFNTGGALRLANNRIVAGVGGPGEDGSAGVAGANGAAGSNGLDATDVYDSVHGCTAANHLVGGSGAAGNCGGTDTSGGAGGLRSCPEDVSLTGLAPSAAERGAPGRNGGGGGGAAGWDVYHQAYACTAYGTWGPLEGLDGAGGQGGAAGAGGSGCAAGSVIAGTWSPGSSGSGGAGLHGTGGGGGGSGAGAWVHPSCFSKGYGGDNVGASGGGGGAGGCAGTEGTGGTSGGSAFGIFVAFDAAPASLPAIVGNELLGGVGGAGGRGGPGAPGGGGGGGGAGGAGGPQTFDPIDPRYPSFQGGAGGLGGSGGHGGGGGGGCGGSTYGIFAWSTGAASLAPWKVENSFGSPGAGGAGGAGGYSPGNPGADGSAGVAAATNF